MASELAIDVRGLTKSYGDFDAVRGIDLAVATGEVFALVGPNGAGKTTTVEILEGHRRRTSGQVLVLGLDPSKVGTALRRRIGIVLQETGVDRFLTVAEVVEQFRSYYPDPLAIDDVLEAVGLTENRDTRVVKLSGGQKRRLDVAVGLVSNGELLFLDEPTTGFDPAARRSAWNMVKSLQALRKTVFLTTHYMDEAQALADRVAVLAGGRIVVEGPPSVLAKQLTMATLIRFRLPRDAPNPPLAKRDADGWSLEARHPTAALRELTTWALTAGLELENLTVAAPTLEDVYLRLTEVSE